MSLKKRVKVNKYVENLSVHPPELIPLKNPLISLQHIIKGSSRFLFFCTTLLSWAHAVFPLNTRNGKHKSSDQKQFFLIFFDVYLVCLLHFLHSYQSLFNDPGLVYFIKHVLSFVQHDCGTLCLWSTNVCLSYWSLFCISVENPNDKEVKNKVLWGRCALSRFV